MSKLDQIVRGKISRPVLVLIYGPDGVGKSSFGAQAPKPIFFGPENGTDFLDVARYPEPEKWRDVISGLDDILSGNHDFESIVIDSLDWLEPLLFTSIIEDDAKGARSIETACGGYGKGYVLAEKIWKEEFIARLTALREKRRMNVILVAHSDVVTFPDPELQTEYKRYELKLNKRASAKFREYVDAVLFCTYKTFVKKDDQKIKAYGISERIMLTEKRPGYDAKNRYGLPHELTLDWNELVSAINRSNPASAQAVKNRIVGFLTTITDMELKQKALAAIEKAGDNVDALTKICNRLAAIAGEAS